MCKFFKKKGTLFLYRKKEFWILYSLNNRTPNLSDILAKRCRLQLVSAAELCPQHSVIRTTGGRECKMHPPNKIQIPSTRAAIYSERKMSAKTRIQVALKIKPLHKKVFSIMTGQRFWPTFFRSIGFIFIFIHDDLKGSSKIYLQNKTSLVSRFIAASSIYYKASRPNDVLCCLWKK